MKNNPGLRPPRHILLPENFIGVLLLCLGLTVIAGWLLHIPAMVEIKTGLVPMVFDTALGFTLTGCAILLMSSPAALPRRARLGIGIVLVLLCSTTLTEQILDRRLGVDLVSLHDWYDYGNTRPGRMAPNTSLGFILIGATILLTDRVSGKKHATAVVLLTFGILTIGLTGLVGYLMAPELLFGWARSARMALHTATGMILSSIALWLTWSRSAWYVSRRYFREDEKIRFLGSAILVVVTLTVGLVGFVLPQTMLEKMLENSLQVVIRNRTPWFISTVDHAALYASTASRLAGLESASKTWLAEPAPANRIRLGDTAAHLIKEGFRGIALQDGKGNLLHTEGRFAARPEIEAPLDEEGRSYLLWDKEMVLRTRLPLVAQNKEIGKLVFDVATPLLNTALFNAAQLGKSGEVGACMAQGDELLCFPGSRHDAPFKVKRRAQTGRPLPLEYALAGKSGIVHTLDYRGQDVVAAYGQLAPGLGFVAKQDTMEAYTVIRNALEIGAPVILMVAMLGAALLYSQLSPLATRMRDSERAASEKELEVRTIMEAVGDGMLTIDEQGRIQSANAAACAIFGYDAAELRGKEFHLLMPAELQSEQSLQGSLARLTGRASVEVGGVRKDGVSFPLELTVNDVPLSDKHLYVGVMRNISERKEAENALTRLAKHDALTGLPNRFLFMDRLRTAVLRSRRSGNAMALMFIDLDGFKQVNDTMGHQAGDELLIQFAHRLASLVRKTDTVARLAGDEFTVILEELMQPQEDVKNIADKIIASVQQPFLIDGREARVTASIGLVIHHADDDTDVAELLHRADQGMYAAKQSGKNAYKLA